MKKLELTHLNFAREQANVLTRKQLRYAGFNSNMIDHRLRTGTWTEITSNVVAIQNTPITRRQDLWAASLHYEHGFLVGEAVLELAGCPIRNARRIDIVSRRGTKKPPRDEWIVHTSRKFPLMEPAVEQQAFYDVAAGGRKPRQAWMSLSTAYAAGTALSDKQAVFFATWPIQQGLVSLPDVLEEVKTFPRTSFGSLCRRRIGMLNFGSHSTWEAEFLSAALLHGLPRPELQAPRLDSFGKVRYLDALFTVGKNRVAVEIDGLGHLAMEQQVQDAIRANELAMQGITVIRIPGIGLRTEPEIFMRQIQRALLN